MSAIKVRLVVKALLAVLALTIGAPSAVSAAVPTVAIPVGSSPAQDVILNFDLRPFGGPGFLGFTQVSIFGLGQGESLTIDLFGGLNGTGGILYSSVVPGPVPDNSGAIVMFCDPGYLAACKDGLWSVGLRLEYWHGPRWGVRGVSY